MRAHFQAWFVLAAACGDTPAMDPEPASTSSAATDISASSTPTSAASTSTDTPTGDASTDETTSSTGDASTNETTSSTDDSTGDPHPNPGCGDPNGAWMWDWSSGGSQAIWGSAADDVWTAGPFPGEARRFDGSEWHMHVLPLGFPSDVTGSAADDVYIADVDGAVHRFDGVAWQPDGAVMLAPSLWAVGPGEVFAVGDSQTFATRKAGQWTTQPLTTPAPLRSLAGSGAADLFAVGDTGTALHFDGDAWTPIASATTADLHGVWPLAPGTAVAVGDTGVVLELTPTSAVAFPPLPAPYTEHPMLAVWAADDAALFIVGVQTLHFFDGAQWLAGSLPFFDSAASVWGIDAHDIFVGGAQNSTLHCRIFE